MEPKAILIKFPPAGLRQRVSTTSDLREYLEIGWRTTSTMVQVLRQNGFDVSRFERILDFACGCGRTLNFLKLAVDPHRLYGCDYDADLVSWCRKNLATAGYVRNNAVPPTEFPDAHFDFVYAISFFTHSPEQAQMAWLLEWRRIIKDDGLLLLTTLGAHRAAVDQTEIPERGFVHVAHGEAFNLRVSYQTREYMESQWCHLFKVLDYQELGLNSQQDIILLGSPAKVHQSTQPYEPLPPELVEAYERRPDLWPVFDPSGIGLPGTNWHNLTLMDWAVLNGGVEEPTLSHLALGSRFRFEESD